jgi:hypothetical protein
VHYACLVSASARRSRHEAKPFGGPAMTPLVIACLLVAAAITGLALHKAQLRLERWDYERHAED